MSADRSADTVRPDALGSLRWLIHVGVLRVPHLRRASWTGERECWLLPGYAEAMDATHNEWCDCERRRRTHNDGQVRGSA